MKYRSFFGAVALLVGLQVMISDALAFDESKYPQWRGQWRRIGGIQWDPSKQLGRNEQPPLKPQYQALFEASLADQATGGQGNDPTFTCIPPGMPRAMTVVFPMEILIMPDTTYMIIEYDNQVRRIYTDGRAWPKDAEPAFAGYSIGQWTDADAQGRFNTLEVEPRGFKGPRSFDASGIPLHEDNQTVVKERIYLDKSDRNVMHNDITTFDHALTEPWTVNKRYLRVQDNKVIFYENECSENNQHVVIGHEGYYLSADGFLMPVKKGQKPPDLRYFKETQK